MNSPKPEVLLDIHQVAQMCNVPRDCVERWVLSARLMECRTFQGELVFRMIDVKAAYLAYLEDPMGDA